MFFWFKKTFDFIDHNVLLQKIWTNGYLESIYDSIDEYLKDRLQ